MPWSKILKFGLPVLFLAGFVWGIYSLGSEAGANRIQKEWDASKAKDAKLVAEEKARLAKNEQAHRAADGKIVNELATLKQTYTGDIARIRGDNALRLRDSEQRAALYKAQAEAGSTERAGLASYAAQLDRSLSEGIGLVEELQGTLELRDGQIRSLGAQILNDRKLIDGSGELNAADTASTE